MNYGRSVLDADTTAIRPTRGLGCGWASAASLRLRRRSAARAGFTLVEVLVVLVLLVVIGSISVPYLFGSFARGQLRNGGDLVKAALTEARLKAMETGQAFVLRMENNGRRFQVGNFVEMATTGNVEAPAAISEIEDKYDTRLTLKQLPSGVIFASSQVAPSPQLIAFLGAPSQEGWSDPIVFLPDGTSTDATILLTNENEQAVRVTLRGITGSVRIGEIGAEGAPK